MRAALHMLLALGAALPAAQAHAYCVRNGLAALPVHAAVVATGPRRPVKTFSETVKPQGEYCCNPKNADCNPDGASDTEQVAFEARVEPGAAPATGAVPCGKPTADPRFPSRAAAAAPARGILRFENNPRFDARRAASPENPPYVAKALTPDNRLVATFFCPPPAR